MPKKSQAVHTEEEISIPYTYMGMDISPNNKTLAAVLVERIRTGKDPLVGTGAVWGDDITYKTGSND